MQCLNCTSEISKNKKFCSQKCSAAYILETHINELVCRLTSGENIKVKNLSRVKLAVIRIKGHKCEECKNTTWLGKPIPLVLDHINGRANLNTLENLRLACGNCDMMLPTYKSKNKNSDRRR